MTTLLLSLSLSVALLAPSAALNASAQVPAVQPTAAPMPPAGAAPVLKTIELRWPTQGNASVIGDNQTYLFYIQIRPSQPSQGIWVPYDEEAVLADFRSLWGTGFLDDLWIEVLDEPYDNGVIGKHVIFNMEELERVRVVNYTGSDELKRDDIDEKLEEKGIEIRLDSFINTGLVNRVEGTLREMFAEKGYQFAEVTHEITAVAGGPKLVHLTFHMDEGPKVQIREIDFIGNDAIGDRTLKGKMKENKERWWLSFISGRGTYKEAKFEEDAERIVEHYRNEGYIEARVGSPQLEYLDESADGETRGVKLRIPVFEGERYRIGSLNFDGHTVVRTEALEEIFKKLKPGRYYSEKQVIEGVEKARELYGTVGYMEFTAFPDLRPRDPAGNGDGGETGAAASARDAEPIVDVTMRVQEGEQYFVNRITFVGNNTTHDEVIRREMRLVENGVFDTEALKFSIRRINQLGYFQPLEDGGIAVEKAGDEENQVDVTLTVEEQNLNQLTFGAGVSQFDGFFGQLSFQTTNFLGRGETLTLAAQNGSRAENYQIAFSEPFMFGRPITAGVDLFKRNIRFISQFTQSSIGGNVAVGLRVADFTQLFMSYSYEAVKVEELNPLFLDPTLLALNPFLQDSLLIGAGGKRTISKVTPSLVYNTVDHPIFPTTGRTYRASVELAGVGGSTNFVKPRLEGIWILRHTSRTSLAFRGQVEYVTPFGGTQERPQELPIFERLVLGGEFSVRGFDIRSIGPTDPATRLVLGGNKSLLFNAEYYITFAQPVRLVLFYDAGQVADRGDQYALDKFRTSTGAEIRFFMPILNVPFRLIFAHNPQREGVFNNRLRPQEANSFRFAVGTTF